MRARTSWAFLLWEGARWGILGELPGPLSSDSDDLGLNSEVDVDLESLWGIGGAIAVNDELKVLEEGK